MALGTLSEDTKRAAIACGKAICTLRYRRYDGYEICDDTSGLLIAAQEFLKFLALSIKETESRPTRINALRFTEPATLPVKAGSTVDLINVHIISGTPSVSDIKLELGDNIHLTKDAPVLPAFCCLLLLAQ